LSGARRPLAALAAVAAGCLVALALAEGGLRWLARAATGRPAPADYGDVHGESLGEGGMLVPGFAGEVQDGSGGTVPWRNEAHGFRADGDVARAPAARTWRLLSLGDSFTAGYRVGQQEHFSRQLEREWNSVPGVPRLEALVAAIEQPATALDYLARFGLAFGPDLVLLGVTLGNDLDQSYVALAPAGDYLLRPGEDPPIVLNPDRDSPAEVARLKELALPAECSDPASARAPRTGAGRSRSRLVELVRTLAVARRGNSGEAVAPHFGDFAHPRLFDGNGLGFCLRQAPAEIELAWERLAGVLAATRDLVDREGSRLALVVFPQRYQVRRADWEATVAAYGLVPSCFDLQLPQHRLAALGKRLGVPVLDPTAALEAAATSSGQALYLPRGDMHWSAAGHRAVARALAPHLRELLAGDPPR